MTHDFEDAFLEWNGGEGLDVFGFRKGPAGGVQILRHGELWRRGSPPPGEARCWFVLDLSRITDGLITVTAEVAGPRRTFEVDLQTLAWGNTPRLVQMDEDAGASGLYPKSND